MEDSTTFDSSMYETTYDSSAVATDSTMSAAGAAAILAANAVVLLIAYVIGSLLMSLVFKKAGVPMWKAWVPVYNLWVFLQLGDQKGWIALLAVIPLLNLLTVWIALVFIVIAAYKIGLKFGKEGWFVLLFIFLSPVWYLWLAFDKEAVWQPVVGAGNDDGTNPPSVPPSAGAPQQPTAL